MIGRLLCALRIHRTVRREHISPGRPLWFGHCTRCGELTWGTR